MQNERILYYIDQLEGNMDGDIWVDETFDKKLKTVDASLAFKRPLDDIHSVGEIVSHLIEWRRSIFSNLKGGLRTIRESSEENWRNNEELSEIGWPGLLEQFIESQQDIINLLGHKEDDFLDLPAKGEKHHFKYYLDGLLQHDMYHLGQIGLVIKMLNRK